MTIKVLVVDDNEDQLTIMDLVLSSAGFHVIKASNAEKGLEKVRASPVDVILCDYMMPHLNGAQMAKQLVDKPIPFRKGRIPFILITANNSLRTVSASLPGVDGIYEKDRLRGIVVERVRNLAQANDLMNRSGSR